MPSLNGATVSDDLSEHDVTSHGTSSASGTGSTTFQDDSPYASPGPGTTAAVNSASTSSKSTGSHQISYTPCDGSVCSLLPRSSASREPGDNLSSVSGLDDPILQHFAQCVPSPPPRASPIRQIGHSDSSSSSAEGAGPEEIDSHSTELGFNLRSVQGTPDTSHAGEDGDIFGLYHGHHRLPIGAANRDLSLVGLDLPGQYSV